MARLAILLLFGVMLMMPAQHALAQANPFAPPPPPGAPAPTSSGLSEDELDKRLEQMRQEIIAEMAAKAPVPEELNLREAISALAGLQEAGAAGTNFIGCINGVAFYRDETGKPKFISHDKKAVSEIAETAENPEIVDVANICSGKK